MAGEERAHEDTERRLRAGGIFQSLASGAVAGAVAKTCIAPLDRTKIYFQVTNRRYRLKKAGSYIVKTFKNDGFFSLWRGNSATMARVVPYAAVQFTAYEQYKILLRPAGAKEGYLPPGRRFIAGSLAGATATLMTYPLDMVRARMAITRREMYRNLPSAFGRILSIEGVSTLYRGATPTILGVIPYAGCSFFTFETIKKWYSDKYHASPTPVQRLIAGAVAGLAGQTTSYPLDVVRRRMQTEGVVSNIKYPTIISSLKYIYRTEGLRGIYKGVSMNWIKGPIVVTISFNTYELVSSLIGQWLQR